MPLFVEEEDLAKINGYVKECFEGKDTSDLINETIFKLFNLTENEMEYIKSEKYLSH